MSWQSLKPGAAPGVHLFLAPLLWSVIGLVLIYRGQGWVGHRRLAVAAVVAVLLGTGKALWVLDRTADKISARIQAFERPTCIGAVYSWKTWCFVAVMMTTGILLRTWTRPGLVVGTLYMAIGWALLFSSRRGWRHWWFHIRAGR